MSEEVGQACLYYDGACPLCRAEIDRLAALADDDLALRDIHQVGPAEGLPPTDTLLQTLHYRDAAGRMKTGLAANVAVWQHTRFGVAWRLLEWPLVRPLANWCYQRWAAWRYRRLYGRNRRRAERPAGDVRSPPR